MPNCQSDIIGNFPATRFRPTHHKSFGVRFLPMKRVFSIKIRLRPPNPLMSFQNPCLERLLPQQSLDPPPRISSFPLPPWLSSVSAGQCRIILADAMTNTNAVGDPEDIQLTVTSYAMRSSLLTLRPPKLYIGNDAVNSFLFRDVRVRTPDEQTNTLASPAWLENAEWTTASVCVSEHEHRLFTSVLVRHSVLEKNRHEMASRELKEAALGLKLQGPPQGFNKERQTFYFSFSMRRRKRRPRDKKKATHVERSRTFVECFIWLQPTNQRERLEEQTERRRSKARNSIFGSGTSAREAQNFNVWDLSSSSSRRWGCLLQRTQNKEAKILRYHVRMDRDPKSHSPTVPEQSDDDGNNPRQRVDPRGEARAPFFRARPARPATSRDISPGGFSHRTRYSPIILGLNSPGPLNGIWSISQERPARRDINSATARRVRRTIAITGKKGEGTYYRTTNAPESDHTQMGMLGRKYGNREMGRLVIQTPFRKQRARRRPATERGEKRHATAELSYSREQRHHRPLAQKEAESRTRQEPVQCPYVFGNRYEVSVRREKKKKRKEKETAKRDLSDPNRWRVGHAPRTQKYGRVVWSVFDLGFYLAPPRGRRGHAVTMALLARSLSDLRPHGGELSLGEA
ncbi:hypothetical protein H4582DRAFT_2054111 [Lactarius indigo]|nr:hypothetical protein H4582DRAFT_2054111 [Lactarius indigo]